MAEMSNVKTAKIVEVIKLNIWVEKDFFGSSHIMMQHGNGEYGEPFCYVSFNYDYAFTSNAQIHIEVVNMMKQFGVEEKDIDWRSRPLPGPKWWHTPVYHVYMAYLWLKRKFA